MKDNRLLGLSRDRYSLCMKPKFRNTFRAPKFNIASRLLFLCLLASLSAGCASLSGRSVTLRPSRLTVLEAHNSQLSSVSRIALSVRKCPASIDAEAMLKNAIGSATSFELVDPKSKERTRDILTVECTTAVDRDGGALGASKPAAIGLLADLSSSNEVIWSARYFYRDEDVSSDVIGLKDRFEVGGGGVRFASLAELAGSGFRELARALGAARSGPLLR